MRSSYLALCFVLAHAVVIAALHWPDWALGLLALLCWGLAAAGAGEPLPTKSPRHRDVQAAERTALGQALLYREGWIIERPLVALGLFVVLSLLVGASVVALTSAEETPEVVVRVFVWAPAVLLATGFVVAQVLNTWVVAGPMLGFWFVFLVLSAAAGHWSTTLRLGAAGLAGVASVFAIDLLRGARRGLERGRRSGS